MIEPLFTDDEGRRAHRVEMEAASSEREPRRRRPRCRHARVGQVGTSVRRVRRRRRAGRARRRRRRRGRTSASSPAARRSATATPATSPARRSRRRSAGRASPSRRATRRARPARRRSTSRARASSPDCATSRSSSARTPRRRASSRRRGRPTTQRPGLAPLPSARRDQPDVLRAVRAPPHGAVRRDRRGLRARQGEEREARPEQPARSLQEGVHRRGRPRVADGVRPAAAAADLRDVGRWRGRRPVVDGLREVARRDGSGPHRRRLDGHADVSEHRHRDAELRDRLRRRPSRRPSSASATRSPRPRTSRPVSARTISTSPRCTTCRPRSSSTGTRTSACARRARPSGSIRDGDTTIGGRIPVNPSGGLACFGEAVPAQAIAQVCELVWQLRGQADGRQVEGAKVGLTINQGLFGHGSSVIVTEMSACLRRTSSTRSARRSASAAAVSPDVHPADLGAHVLKAIVDRNDIDPLAVEDVFFGCVDTIGPQAGDIARTCWLAAGLPEEVPGVDDRPSVRIVPAGAALRRASRDVRNERRDRRRRRPEHVDDPDRVRADGGRGARHRGHPIRSADRQAGSRATAIRRSRSSGGPR